MEDGTTIDNNATKVSYNKTYEATVSTEGNYAITGITVTMGGQAVTTSGNNVVDINTGKIKIEKVTGDIDIKVTTKELKIQYTAVAVSKSNSSTATSSEEANTIERGTTLYINIIATLEGNKCTAVLKSDNSKTVPYQVASNGKYTFKVSGTYNGKTISEDKEITVNQYMSVQNIVQYDAGNWTKEEIEELQKQRLYMINKEKTYNSTFNLNNKDTGLNFTFGGFTYEGDTANASDIENGNIIISRNQSIESEEKEGPKYSGWQVLKTETKQDKSGQVIKNADGSYRRYVTKLVHAGSPENFVYSYDDAGGAEYILSSGKEKSQYNTFSPRDWSMYEDKNLKQKNYISEVHAMTYTEATEIAKNASSRKNILSIGKNYWLEDNGNNTALYYVSPGGDTISYTRHHCWGIRPVVTMSDGVYIKSGSGTESDPYILGKDE